MESSRTGTFIEWGTGETEGHDSATPDSQASTTGVCAVLRNRREQGVFRSTETRVEERVLASAEPRRTRVLGEAMSLKNLFFGPRSEFVVSAPANTSVRLVRDRRTIFGSAPPAARVAALEVVGEHRLSGDVGFDLEAEDPVPGHIQVHGKPPSADRRRKRSVQDSHLDRRRPFG